MVRTGTRGGQSTAHSPRPPPTMAQCRRDKCRVAWELGKSFEAAPRNSPVRKFYSDSISHRVTKTPDLANAYLLPARDSGVNKMEMDLLLLVTRHEKSTSLFGPTPFLRQGRPFAFDVRSDSLDRWVYCVHTASLVLFYPVGTALWCFD